MKMNSSHLAVIEAEVIFRRRGGCLAEQHALPVMFSHQVVEDPAQ
jgi:hypothetical protein